MPPPLEGELQLPALLPSYDQVAASVITTRVQKAHRGETTSSTLDQQYQRSEPQSQQQAIVQLWDEGAKQMTELAVTDKNIPKIAELAQVVQEDGVNVIQCPLTQCNRSVGNRSALHKHLNTHLHEYQRRSTSSRGCDDKLCPLCRSKNDSYEDLINHIVNDHDTRLECTEHEFETMWDFKQWKEKVEQEDEAMFQLGRWGAGHYSCSRGGTKTVKSNRRPRLGFECPAAIVVHSNKTHGQPSRIQVTYWRTHIGHAPSLVDIRMPKEHVEWIVSLLKNGHSIRSIIAYGASQYLGPPLSKIHMLTERYLRYVINDAMASADKKKTTLKCPSDPPKVYEYGNVDQLRVALAGIIHDEMIREDEALRLAEEAAFPQETGQVTGKRKRRSTKCVLDNDEADQWTRGPARHNDKCLTAYDVLEHTESGRYQVLGHGYKSIHKGEQPSTVVVFPRKSSHVSCERKCPQCQVCVHRYGCTCRWYMMHSRMCAHIHRVASLKGAPSSEYVDPTVAGADTLGLQEALNRLQNLNRRERLKPLEPLINELFQLMKSDHGVHPDELESYVRQGIEMMRRYRPIQLTRDDEALRGIQPLKATEARLFLRNRHPEQKRYKILATNWDIDPKVRGCKGGVMVQIDGVFKLIPTWKASSNTTRALNSRMDNASVSNSVRTSQVMPNNSNPSTAPATSSDETTTVYQSQAVTMTTSKEVAKCSYVSRNPLKESTEKPTRRKRAGSRQSDTSEDSARPSKRPTLQSKKERPLPALMALSDSLTAHGPSDRILQPQSSQRKVVVVKIARVGGEHPEVNPSTSSALHIYPESTNVTQALSLSNIESAGEHRKATSISICVAKNPASSGEIEMSSVDTTLRTSRANLGGPAVFGTQSSMIGSAHIIVEGTPLMASGNQLLEPSEEERRNGVDMFVAQL
ncbi:uncharacterized protein LOC111245608 isoform X2 [Varroa destructor]|nr:uncharacterized protein LOC111245608 isoform X2 [Varroa destructor]